jgi:hypothetical protein
MSKQTSQEQAMLRELEPFDRHVMMVLLQTDFPYSVSNIMGRLQTLGWQDVTAQKVRAALGRLQQRGLVKKFGPSNYTIWSPSPPQEPKRRGMIKPRRM